MFGKNSIVGKKYFENAGDKVMVTSVFMTLQGEGPYRGEPAVFVRLSKCNLACSFCFVPSTNILMGNGKQKKIKNVKVGDIVMSWAGDKFEPKKVTRKYKSIATDLVKIEIDCVSTTWCTPEHPFLVSGKGWVEAKDLQPNDKLIHYNSSARMTMFNPMFNSENHREMSADEKKKASKRLSRLWKDSEFREKNIQRLRDHNPMKDPKVSLKSFLSRQNQTKSKLEETIEKICEGLPIEFVGDGKLSISYKVPDFVVNGQKKVIEIWPDDALWVKNKPRNAEWMENRRKLFAKEGYDTLFLPLVQSDLKIDNHKNIREKVAQFINNGNIVKSVTPVKDNRAFARLYGTKTAKRYVYNLEVEDNHTYVANNIVVHNCDTWFDSGDWLTLDELMAKIRAAVSSAYNNNVPEWLYSEELDRFGCGLVITGGEPMLQKNIQTLLYSFEDHFNWTQIESNGTSHQIIPFSTTLVVSPKCSEKNGKPVKYLEPHKDVLKRANCLKFVMNADPDSPYSSIPEWALEWKKQTGKPVFVSPMNIYNKEPERNKSQKLAINDRSLEQRSVEDEVISFWEPDLLNMEQNKRNHEYAARYALDHGCILNLQIHLYASLA